MLWLADSIPCLLIEHPYWLCRLAQSPFTAPPPSAWEWRSLPSNGRIERASQTSRNPKVYFIYSLLVNNSLFHPENLLAEAAAASACQTFWNSPIMWRWRMQNMSITWNGIHTSLCKKSADLAIRDGKKMPAVLSTKDIIEGVATYNYIIKRNYF